MVVLSLRAEIHGTDKHSALQQENEQHLQQCRICHECVVSAKFCLLSGASAYRLPYNCAHPRCLRAAKP